MAVSLEYFHFHLFILGIGEMKSLETLNLCKNRLTKLPLDLAKSASLVELFVNDNDLIEIPTKILSIQSLRILEAERRFTQKKKKKQNDFDVQKSNEFIF